jgi:tetratricopeptide (TPR) repeat protein
MTAGLRRRRTTVTLDRVLTLAALLGLAGCGSAPPSTVPASPTPTPVQAAPAADPAARTLAEFATRQRNAADTAANQGRWADALSALEVLRALRPDDAAVVQQLARARAAAETEAREHLQRGRAAAQGGDTEAASRAFLEALVLDPKLNEAADALRAQERERVRRQHLGKLSRYAMGNTAASLQDAPPAQAVLAELEHASMLADQGEFEAAAATLKPLAEPRSASTAVTRLLAEIYFRHAETLVATNKPAARAALERCLQIDRSHPRALALARQLPAR